MFPYRASLPRNPRPWAAAFLALPALAGSLTLTGPAVVQSEGGIEWRVTRGGLPEGNVQLTLRGEGGEELTGAVASGALLYLGPGRYAYFAPAVTRDLVFTLRAAPWDDPADVTERRITVRAGESKAPAKVEESKAPLPASRPAILPPELLDLVAAYADEPFTGTAFPRARGRRPFFDLATGRRTGAGPEVRLDSAGQPADLVPMPRFREWAPGSVWSVGYGLQVPFRLDPGPGRGSSLLSFQDTYSAPGADITRREYRLGPFAPVALAGNVASLTLEDLRRVPGQKDWVSRLSQAPLVVRGLVPLAGIPEAPAVREGRGMQARCHSPLGMVGLMALSPRPGRLAPFGTFYTEPEAQVLGVVHPDGSVRTLCGHPYERGFRDGTAREARFNGPTYVAAVSCLVPPRGGQPLLYVSDSGNAAIRTVDPVTGRVGTFARAGLKNPQGLVPTRTGAVIVADQGDFTLKYLTPDGGVTVLAGLPGAQGSQDGTGAAARFTELKALVVDPGSGVMHVLDGNALRRVDVHGGGPVPVATVTTLAGSVTGAGFCDPPPDAAPGTPCLRGPWGLVQVGPKLFIADTGNHAIRCFDPASGVLRTVAGDPGAGRTAWGLLRDGLAALPAEGYGTLEAPRGLAFRLDETFQEILVASSGSCLGEVRGLGVRGPNLVFEAWAGPGATRGFTVTAWGAAAAPGPAAPFDFRYWVAYAGPHGLLDEPAPALGPARIGEPVTLPAVIPGAAGEMVMRVRIVTNSGHSQEFSAPVPAQAAPAPAAPTPAAPAPAAPAPAAPAPAPPPGA